MKGCGFIDWVDKNDDDEQRNFKIISFSSTMTTYKNDTEVERLKFMVKELMIIFVLLGVCIYNSGRCCCK